MKTLTIFSYELAKILIKKGQKMVGTKPNYKMPHFYVYYFTDTPEARQICKTFYQNKRKKHSIKEETNNL